MCPLSDDAVAGRRAGVSLRRLRQADRLLDGTVRIGHHAAQRDGFPDREHHRVQRGPGGKLNRRGLGLHSLLVHRAAANPRG